MGHPALRGLPNQRESRGQGTQGQLYLNEWEEEPDSKVGEPVDRARDDEGSRPLGLLEKLPGQDEGNATCRAEPGGISHPGGRQRPSPLARL